MRTGVDGHQDIAGAESLVKPERKTSGRLEAIHEGV